MPCTTTYPYTPTDAPLLPPPKTPCPKLLERLTDDQQTSFLYLWDKLLLYLRDITFDLSTVPVGLRWSSQPWEAFFARFPMSFPRPKPKSARAPFYPVQDFRPPG